MKRILFLLLALLVLLSGCALNAAAPGRSETGTTSETAGSRPAEAEPVYAVWLTCYELNAMLNKPGEAAFRAAFEQAAQRCAAGGINTLFVQVRPFCDAFYPSALFPWSDLCRDRNKAQPDFDPLAVMVELAHRHGLRLHAWVNPYRVSYSSDALPASLSAYQSCVGATESGTWFDPSKAAELLQNYAVDGVHFDDYFYPTAQEDFDRQSYAEACALGNDLGLADWRREQVNRLLRGAYTLVKSFGSEKIFSVSPAGDIGKNCNQAFADVETWLAQGGYADWVIPQLYYGFAHETKPFEAMLRRWGSLPRADSVRLLCGLAAYKQGQADKLAGTGEAEWVENADTLTRQMGAVTADAAWSGWCLFSYSQCGF